MRYLILKPRSGPIDPRGLDLASQAALHEAIPPISEHDTEEDAARRARRFLPDAVALPMPVRVGSGHTVLLGFISEEDQRRAVDPDAALPFVLFVQPVTQTDHERAKLKKGASPFRMDVWKLWPICPDIYEPAGVELRATEFPSPVFTEARHGAHNGRLTIFVQVGESQMSMVFDNPELKLVDSGDADLMLGDAGAADAVERWAIGKRVVLRKEDASLTEDRWEVVDAITGERSGYREMFDRDGGRDLTPHGDPPNHPAAVMVLHPAAIKAIESAGTLNAMASRFQRDVHVVQHGSRWWWVFVGEPPGDVYNENGNDCRCWFVVKPDGSSRNLAAS